MTAYKQQYEGEWVEIPMRGDVVACCSCGLTHKMNYKKSGRRFFTQVFLQPRKTAMVRRHLRKKGHRFPQ